MIIDNADRFWIYVLASTARPYPTFRGKKLTREEYMEHWGKWIISDDRPRLDELAKELEIAVEMDIIYMIKYTREGSPVFGFEKPIMCIFCDGRDREEVAGALSLVGVTPTRWMYEKEMFQLWSPGGAFFEKWVEVQGLSEAEEKEIRGDILRQQEAWLNYAFVSDERFGRLREKAPIWSLEDIHLLPKNHQLRAITPIVSIVGKSNVGKSTLFNKLVGEKRTIVDDASGTTRDRVYVDVCWGERSFTLLDTGGLEANPDADIDRRVNDQVRMAVEESDAIIFLVDGQQNIDEADRETADLLLRARTPVILAANKMDQEEDHEEATPPFKRLGFGEPLLISALYNIGLDELKDQIIARFPPSLPHLNKSGVLKLAIVGRPNVGKSMLLNALLGRERAVVAEVPGTTLDSMDTLFYYRDNEPLLLIDTAGLRHLKNKTEGPEHHGMLQSREVIKGADVVLFLLDAQDLVADEDIVIKDLLDDPPKVVLVLVNKWDLVEDKSGASVAKIEEGLRSSLKLEQDDPILFVSAKYGEGIEEIVPAARRSFVKVRANDIPGAISSESLKEFVKKHPLPSVDGKDPGVCYAIQTALSPLSFVFFVKDRSAVPMTSEVFVEGTLREYFGLGNLPMRIVFKDIDEASE
ncbi:MAG: ribosome biogenesis GTPase Der [Desulfatiglans sp.]|jgi:GTP-binding protein|nr:ribosome biogenesis GTPase Der [Desulfatiglans sp.]